MRRSRPHLIGVATAAAVLTTCGLLAQTAPHVLKLEGDVAPVHDPVVIKERDTCYVFSTGGRSDQGVIPIRTSRDMRTWKLSGHVFESLPEWARTEIPLAKNAWAPLQPEVPPVLLRLVIRQPQLRDRADHDAHTRSREPRLPME